MWFTYLSSERIDSWDHDALASGPETFSYDSLGNLTLHGGVEQKFEDATRPHAITERAGSVYGYDASGNLASITGASGSRHFLFDSADRLRCIGSQPGGCDQLRVTYDAAGNRVKERLPGVIRVYTGLDHVYEGNPDTQLNRSDVRAFGERVAYLVSQPDPLGAGRGCDRLGGRDRRTADPALHSRRRRR